MDAERIAIIGAGNVNAMPSIAGALATYFGERPLEVRLFDGDAERLDLIDRFCRILFTFNRAPHTVSATVDPMEAIEGVDRVILCADDNCAITYFRAVRRRGVATGVDAGLVDQLIEAIVPSLPDSVEVLSLLGEEFSIPLPHYRKLGGPPRMADSDVASNPHQILRFLNGEEYPVGLLKDAGASPLKAWLEDVEAAPSTLGRREA